MNEPKFRAINMAVRLVKVSGMSLWNACRAAAFSTGVDSDWIYRELTEKR